MALHVRGVLLPDDEVRDLWLVGDRVTFEPVPGAETVADGGFILPGLVDAHCHIGIARGGAPITSLDQARALARIDRDAGVLALRDAGSPFPYPELDDEPDLPRLVRAGRHVAPPKRYLRDIGVEVGAAEVAATVTEQAAAGNGWVKLVGDWIDRGVGDLAPADTMTAAVAAAHAAGVRAAVHTFSESAVEVMVRAGVDSVEHGTGLSLDLIDLMARQGTALVPTMINIRTFGHIADQARAKFPGYAEHMLALRDRFPQVVRSAYEAGVPIYVGTTPVAVSTTASPSRRCSCCTSRPACPPWTCSPPPPGEPAPGSASRPRRRWPGRPRHLPRRPRTDLTTPPAACPR